MLNCARSVGIIVALLLAPAAATAQIVNVLAEISQRGDEGFGGEVAGALTRRTGNTNTLDLSASAAAAYRHQAHTVYVIGRTRYNKAVERVVVSQAFEHLRYRHGLLDWLGLEAYLQHEYDKFRRLRLRALLGAGPRLALRVVEGFEVAWGTAYMLEHEELLEPTGTETSVHRLSNYLQVGLQASDALRLQSTTIAQPRLGHIRDVRVLSEAALIVKGNAWLGVRIACRFAYDSRPPPRVERLDTTVESSVVLTL